VDDDLFYRWQTWANDPDECDISGENCFHDLERSYCYSMLADGDIVSLGTNIGALQTIEAHQIQTSTTKENTVLGVTLDNYRKRLRYWYRADDIKPHGKKEQAVPIDVRDENGYRVLFHLYNAKRVSQTRGVTALAPIFSTAGMFEDVNFAKLVQQQIVSCVAFIRNREEAIGNPAGYGEAQNEATGTGSQQRQTDAMTPGMEIWGNEGETISAFSPNIPNAEYFQQVRLLLQIMGMNLGVPLCLVLMDGSETNFSGWRGAVEEAKKGFRANQMNIMNRFHRPCYKWKVRQWMAEDPALRKAASAINIFGHRWSPPRSRYINPKDDAAGDILQLQTSLTSRRRLHNDNGSDWEEIADEQIADNAYAIQKAIAQATKINKKFSKNEGFTPIHWSHLIGLTMPPGVTMNMQDPVMMEKMDESNE
jgi:capsid protein